jgi:ribosomal-protein-alanine N-acetyltransferase
MLNHSGSKIIETDRLILRPFVMADAEDMFRNWANDPEVTKYLTWAPHGRIEITREILKIWTSAYGKKDYYQWAMVIKETGDLVGSIGVVSYDDGNEHCEIGYCSAQKAWGKGYMTEALIAMMDYLFETVGFHRISGIHYEGNDASCKVMTKAGMTYEGTKRGYYKNADSQFIDCLSFAKINPK